MIRRPPRSTLDRSSAASDVYKRQELYNLPESPGIYYMRNANGDPIYIGKSKNIRDRVFQHLNETTSKTKRMIDGIHSIDFLISGNELMASLLEVQEIKKFQPEINSCLLYTSDAADERSSVDLGGRRIIKKKKRIKSRI